MGIWRIGLTLAAMAGAWWLGAGEVLAQGTPIPSLGRVRVAALRIEFVPGVPPRAPTGQPQLPQLPSTRFQRAYDQQYIRDVMSEVRSYFQEVSLGKVDVETTVIGPVVAERDYDKDMVYYGQDANEPGLQRDLIQRAMTLSEQSVDFNQVDLVVVFHAGPGQESDLQGNQTADYILSNAVMASVTGNGKTFPAAVLQSSYELTPPNGTGEQLSLVGRLCRSIAMVLGPGATPTGPSLRGLPTDNAMVGVWDLMDRGWMMGPVLPRSGVRDWSSPAHLNPFDKMRLGWLQPIVVKNNLPNAQIEQVETSGTVFQLWKEGRIGHEYFLVENRQRFGFDSYLPEGGLLVWRANEAVADQGDAQNLRVQLIQADGRQDIESQQNGGDNSDCFPGQLSVTKLSDETTPSTRDSHGAATYVSVTDISNPAQVMRASLYIVPAMIMSLRPGANFVTESVTPTFRATFSEQIDPNSIKVVIDNQTVVDKSNLSQWYNPATREMAYTTKQLAFAQHTINISVKNPNGTVEETTGDMTFRVNFRTVPAGLRMVSVPYVLKAPDNDPGVVFGVGSGSLRMARWNPVKKAYAYYPNPDATLNPPADDPANPGHTFSEAPAGLAFWVNLSTDSPARVKGDQLEGKACRIPLYPGWNMIGCPFPFPVDWNGCQVEYRGVTKTLTQAVDEEWISGSLYSYQPGGYTWANAPAGQLHPWEGYWVKVKVTDGPIALWVPPVESGIGSLTGRQGPEDGWRLRIGATAQSGARDTHNFIGVSRAARDGADNADVEKPPVPSAGTVSLRLLEGGRALAQDLRAADLGNGKSWEFEVTTDLAQERITLTWPDLSTLPKNLEVRLKDLATGREVYARTRGGYSYNSGEGGTRRFRLTVGPRQTAPLMISDVSVSRTRGVPAVRFSLNRDAIVAVEIVGPNGKRVQHLTAEYAGSTGINSVSSGRADGLAPGLYLVQITATASDGVSSQAVKPLVVTR